MRAITRRGATLSNGVRLWEALSSVSLRERPLRNPVRRHRPVDLPPTHRVSPNADGTVIPRESGYLSGLSAVQDAGLQGSGYWRFTVAVAKTAQPLDGRTTLDKVLCIDDSRAGCPHVGRSAQRPSRVSDGPARNDDGGLVRRSERQAMVADTPTAIVSSPKTRLKVRMVGPFGVLLGTEFTTLIGGVEVRV